MPLNDVDLARRRLSIGYPVDLVDFTVYSYNGDNCEQMHFTSISRLIRFLETHIEHNEFYWIEVFNRSSVNLPKSIERLCDYLDMHQLTIEDISTLTSSIKIDIFPEKKAIYMLMKTISWNNERVGQQQISLYFQPARNLLLTFQEKKLDEQSYFDLTRHQHQTIERLFCSLIYTIIDRSIDVIEQIALKIDQYDEQFMIDKPSLNTNTFHSIYRLKHDLLHLRILFNPLKDVLWHLERTTNDEKVFLHLKNDTGIYRLDLHHHIQPPQINPIHISTASSTTSLSTMNSRRTSVYFNENSYLYLRDLDDHINLLINSIEIQREHMSNLVSLWFTLTNNQTQRILKFLMLISVLFMPCLLLTGIFSTNFNNEPPLHFKFGYYIVLITLVITAGGMVLWYKYKKWI